MSPHAPDLRKSWMMAAAVDNDDAGAVLNQLKTRLRDALPKRLQVPAKYWFSRALGHLENEMQFLDLLVNRHDRVIDVGGNRGIYSYCLWKLGAQVEVFEPNERCQQVLSYWAADKRGVTLHPVALSNHQGIGALHIPLEPSGIEHDASASLENEHRSGSRKQDVQLRTLDSYDFTGVTLIKIDVEGHEYSVIEGAAATITSSRPALLVEIEQRHIARPIAAVFEQIQNLGYRGFFLHDGSLQGLEYFDAARDQSPSGFGDRSKRYINNFLFLHRDRLAAGEYGALVEGIALT